MKIRLVQIRLIFVSHSEKGAMMVKESLTFLSVISAEIQKILVDLGLWSASLMQQV